MPAARAILPALRLAACLLKGGSGFFVVRITAERFAQGGDAASRSPSQHCASGDSARAKVGEDKVVRPATTMPTLGAMCRLAKA